MAELAQKVYGNMPPPKYFLEVRGANHFSFNNRFTDNGMATLLSGSPKHFEIIRRYSTAFLEKHVAGRRDAKRVLERSDPMLTRYVTEPKADEAGRKAEALGETPRGAENAPKGAADPRR